MEKLTFLKPQQVCNYVDRLDIFNKIGTKAVITDFAILSGGFATNSRYYYINEERKLENRTGNYWTRDSGDNTVAVVKGNGYWEYFSVNARFVGCRPVLYFSNINDIEIYNTDENVIFVTEYGYYPRTAVSGFLQKHLEKLYVNGELIETGNSYVTDGKKFDSDEEDGLFLQHTEYECDGKRYVRVKANFCKENMMLSNGKKYKTGDYVWVEVEPVRWFVDEESSMMFTKEIIVAGVKYKHINSCLSNFDDTNIGKFINNYLLKDMFQMRKLTVDDVELENDILTREQELINEILKLINQLESEEQVKYRAQLNLIINEYECVKEQMIPDFNDSFISLKTETIVSANAKLLSNLQLLYLKLSSVPLKNNVNLIKRNIINLENGRETIEVENKPHSFEISYYLGIQSFVKDIIDYVSKDELYGLSVQVKDDISSALKKTILECNSIIESTKDIREKFKLIGAKVFEYKMYVDDVLKYEKNIKRLVLNQMIN